MAACGYLLKKDLYQCTRYLGIGILVVSRYNLSLAPYGL